MSPQHTWSYVDRTLHRRGDAKFNSRQITLFWEKPNFIAAKICWFTVICSAYRLCLWILVVKYLNFRDPVFFSWIEILHYNSTYHPTNLLIQIHQWYWNPIRKLFLSMCVWEQPSLLPLRQQETSCKQCILGV